MISKDQLILVCRFLHEPKPDFIELAWAGDQHLINHFKEKLDSIITREGTYYRNYQVMVRFIGELSGNNVEILANHINKYHG